MASYNKVILLGNLTRDPELRYTNSGTAVCEFGLAVNRRIGNDPNKDEVCFVDIVVWDKQAESTGRILQKGAPALIEGRLQFDQWQDRETGQKRSRLRVVAERVQFIGSRQDRDDYDGDQQQNHAPRQNQPPRNQYPQQQRGYQNQGGGYQQQGGGNQPPPRQQNNNYQPPQPQQGGSHQDPPMPSPDAFDVGIDGAEDDIPF